MGTKSGPEAGAEGILEDLEGKVKEVVEHEAEAEAARAEAASPEADQRTHQ